MSEPKLYPWTARFAATKQDAKKAATAAGRKQADGASEYDAASNLRRDRMEKRWKRTSVTPVPKHGTVAEYMTRTDARELAARCVGGEIDFRGAVRCGKFIQLRFSRMLTKLGIPVRKVLRGFDGGRYGWKPSFSLLVLRDEYADFVAYRAATKTRRDADRTRRVKARETEIAARDALAESLGVLPCSRAFAWYMAGEIDADECRRIGGITRRRHEETNYDALLSAGYAKDDARAFME